MKTVEELAAQCADNASSSKRLLTCLIWLHLCLCMVTVAFIYSVTLDLIYPKQPTPIWLRILSIFLNCSAAGINVWRIIELRREIPKQWKMWMERRQELLDLK